MTTEIIEKTAMQRALYLAEKRVASYKDVTKRLSVANSEASKFRTLAEKRATNFLTMPLTGTECDRVFQLIDEARK